MPKYITLSLSLLSKLRIERGKILNLTKSARMGILIVIAVRRKMETVALYSVTMALVTEY
jgi:hypothetical protein